MNKVDRRTFMEQLLLPLVAGALGGLVSNVGATLVTNHFEPKHDLSVIILRPGAELTTNYVGEAKPTGNPQWVTVKNNGDFTEISVDLAVLLEATDQFEVVGDVTHTAGNRVLGLSSNAYPTGGDEYSKTYEAHLDRLHPGEGLGFWFFTSIPVEVSADVRSLDDHSESHLASDELTMGSDENSELPSGIPTQ